MANLKDLSKREELFTGGHRACAGCAGAIALRQVLVAAAAKPVVVGSATGCMEVVSTIFPFTSWKTPFIHSAFENVAATISGAEAAYRGLKRQGKMDKEINFIAIGGDGGTYDIGLQALSGAVERRHNMLYVCYNNEAYMNCLSLSAIIATKDGLKKITEVRLGEQVYAFDLTTHNLVLKRCSGIFDNGIKDVYELSTLHHSIKATSNHPFLIAIRNNDENTTRIACQTKTNVFIWKTLEQIELEDEVVVLRDFERDFVTEEVISIKYIGKEPTLDLRVEDEHNFIANGIVVHNTGIQRSGATPLGASTTTAPAGTIKQGKEQQRKDLTKIMVAHNISYAAQTIVGNWKDLTGKVEKALSINGPKFINILAPCRLGWGYAPEDTIDLGMLAADTCIWPLYEVVDGKYALTYKPKEKKPVIEYLKTQARYKHLLSPENKPIVESIQAAIDAEWQELLKLSSENR